MWQKKKLILGVCILVMLLPTGVLSTPLSITQFNDSETNFNFTFTRINTTFRDYTGIPDNYNSTSSKQGPLCVLHGYCNQGSSPALLNKTLDNRLNFIKYSAVAQERWFGNLTHPNISVNNIYGDTVIFNRWANVTETAAGGFRIFVGNNDSVKSTGFSQNDYLSVSFVESGVVSTVTGCNPVNFPTNVLGTHSYTFVINYLDAKWDLLFDDGIINNNCGFNQGMRSYSNISFFGDSGEGVANTANWSSLNYSIEVVRTNSLYYIDVPKTAQIYNITLNLSGFRDYVYPQNITIDTGNDGFIDYRFGSILNETNSPINAYLNISAVQQFLEECVEDDNDECQVPLNISSIKVGGINPSGLNITGETFSFRPNISMNYTFNQGFTDSNFTGQVTVFVDAPGTNDTLCNITIRDTEYQNQAFLRNATLYHTNFVDGPNNIDIFCLTPWGYNNTLNETIDFQAKRFNLINEETGDPYIITTENITIYAPGLQFNYSFSNESNSVWYISNDTDDIRLDIRYEGLDGVVTRDFNPGLHESNITRLCVPPSQTVYEQLIYATTERAISLHNPYADCLIAEDYLKYAFSDALMIRAFTIPKFYDLYIYDDNQFQQILSQIDGGTAQQINLDLVEFANQTYTITVLTEALGVSALDNETIRIYYANPRLQNSRTVITIYNGSNILLQVDTTTLPNEVTVNFSHAHLNLTDLLLRVTVDKYDENNDLIGSITRLFYANGLSGFLNPWVAIGISFILMFFGLTFVAVRYVFGPFGIVVTIIGLAILTQAPANQYVVLAQVIVVLMLIFQLILMKESSAKLIV